MSLTKALTSSECEEIESIDDQVKYSELHKQSVGARAFHYKLNEKSAKSKLIKGAKRIPFLVQDNLTSSNLIFSVGAWRNAVLTAVSYWNEVKGTKSCKIGDYCVKVAGVKAGSDVSENII